MAFDLDELSDRELIGIALSAIALVSALAWGVFDLFLPAAPARLEVVSGPLSGAYHQRALRLSVQMHAQGVTLHVSPTQGTPENLDRLQSDRSDQAQVAFVQGGITDLSALKNVESIGRLGLEPVWVFYKAQSDWHTLSAMKGRRVSIGVPRGGTQPVARAMLGAAQLNASNTTLLELSNDDALQALESGRIDAFFAVAACEAPIIQRALRDGLRVLDFAQGPALSSRFTWLSVVVLPRGGISLDLDLPPSNVRLVAVDTELVVRSSLHPATKALLRRTAIADLGIASRSPLLRGDGMQEAMPPPVVADPPFLEKYLPFWWAQLIHRISLSILPVIVLGGSAIHAMMDFRRRRTHLKILHLFAQAKEIQLRAARQRCAGEGVARQLIELEERLRAVSPQMVHLVDYYRLKSILVALGSDKETVRPQDVEME